MMVLVNMFIRNNLYNYQIWIEQSRFNFGYIDIICGLNNPFLNSAYIYILIFASLSIKIQGRKVSSKETQVSLTGHDANESFPSK